MVLSSLEAEGLTLKCEKCQLGNIVNNASNPQKCAPNMIILGHSELSQVQSEFTLQDESSCGKSKRKPSKNKAVLDFISCAGALSYL